MNTMLNSEILNRTADVMEERGYGHGSTSLVGEDGICVEGAMHLVLHGSLPYINGPMAESKTYLGVEFSPAGLALKQYLDEPYQHSHLYAWNDAQYSLQGCDKAKAQQVVVEALRACALIEASKEDGTYVEPEPVTVAEAYEHLGYFSIPVTVCPVGGLKFESDFESIKVKYDSAISGDEVFQMYPGDKLHLSVEPLTLATV